MKTKTAKLSQTLSLSSLLFTVLSLDTLVKVITKLFINHITVHASVINYNQWLQK